MIRNHLKTEKCFECIKVDIPPQLSMTLEHIVGQLDVLTQVGRENISEQGIICRNQEP